MVFYFVLSSLIRTFAAAKGASGGIGRRARLRIWCFTTCRFESYLAHKNMIVGIAQLVRVSP